MRFGEVDTGDAVGGRLAHSLRLAGGSRVAKGTLVDAALVRRLTGAGIARITVALPDPDDVHEDAAAARVAGAFAGVAADAAVAGGGIDAAAHASGLHVGTASTGRANVHAARDGLFDFDREAVLAANAVDEGLTLATLGENLVVPAGRMVATVKIVPFALPERAVAGACAALVRGVATVHGLMPHRAALVQTVLPSLSVRALDKTLRVTEARLAARGAALVVERRCMHSNASLVAELARLPTGLDWVLIVGASAIADRRDVIPAAVEALGGTVHRLGLAVDPGNLLMLAELDGRTVLGLPGCARSPADNGVDRILDRLACDVPTHEAWLRSLAIGGLLGEIVERPSPRRSVPPPRAPSRGRVGVLVLAGGASRRAGAANKLLHPMRTDAGEAPIGMVRATVLRALDAGVGEVVVVTGHAAEDVEGALLGLDVRTVHNPAAASGLASSLVRGMSAFAGPVPRLETAGDAAHGTPANGTSARATGPAREDAGIGAVIVCLADMPLVRPATLRALVDAWSTDPAIHAALPVHAGRRGNPVLLGRARFDDVLALRGDVGARGLLGDGAGVLEVVVDDPGVLVDHDTPEALASLDDG